MQIIMPASEKIIKTMGKPKTSDGSFRRMCYVVEKPVDNGVLLFHTLTRELLQLSREEYMVMDSMFELREKWFFVPETLNDQSYADRVRFVLGATAKKPKFITGYTIFTTTDCNARCFYCYEMGRSRIPMSEETARKVASYIVKHCGDKKVSLSWFGGEPLFNKKVIDIICNDLNKFGIAYQSSMISNGYLFDAKIVQQAKELWKVRRVQITLDGTEAVYNRSKAYIYKNDTSPYRIVLENIDKLLDVGICVSIRMNIDKHNAEDLLKLADELHERFGEKKGLSVYSHVLFEFSGAKEKVRTEEERRLLYQQQQTLEKKLSEYGYCHPRGLSRRYRTNYCMADSGTSVTILPGGEIGVCEHYSEDHFIGHIDSETQNASVLKEFRQTREPIAECKTCFYYPQCIRLKLCEETKECFPEMREAYLQKSMSGMQAVYAAWLEKEVSEGIEETADC